MWRVWRAEEATILAALRLIRTSSSDLVQVGLRWRIPQVGKARGGAAGPGGLHRREEDFVDPGEVARSEWQPTGERNGERRVTRQANGQTRRESAASRRCADSIIL